MTPYVPGHLHALTITGFVDLIYPAGVTGDHLGEHRRMVALYRHAAGNLAHRSGCCCTPAVDIVAS